MSAQKYNKPLGYNWYLPQVFEKQRDQTFGSTADATNRPLADSRRCQIVLIILKAWIVDDGGFLLV